MLYFSSILDRVSQFVIDIIQYVRRKLIEKEANMYEANNWVKNEAQEHNHLPNYGTFRQALFQCIKERIVPIITELLSGINKFENLKILHKPQYKELWMKLFHMFVAENLLVDRIHNSSNWIAKFPFSFIIMVQVENLLKIHPTYGNE